MQIKKLLKQLKEEATQFKVDFSFIKSIRFKLTLIYSFILLCFSLTILSIFNIYNLHYLRRDPSGVITVNHQGPLTQAQIRFISLNAEEQQRIRDIREMDLERIQIFSLFSIFPIVILSFTFGYYVSGTFLKPIDDLRIQIENMKAKNLGKKLPKVSDDEIGKLIDSFNDMSERLYKSFDAQLRFVQDASHELRTPLTVIQLNLDTILEDSSATKEDLKVAMQNALSGMKRINRLTDDLLELSRPDSNSKEVLNLEKVIKDQIRVITPLAKEAGVEINTNLEKDITFNINEIRFGRAIFNLLENAVKYSKDVPKPEIEINLVKELGKVLIEVKDNGKGIPKNQISKIFDRFYRVDKSRSRNGDGGFGLGLAITKKIIEDHGGKIEAKVLDNQTVFTIKISSKSET